MSIPCKPPFCHLLRLETMICLRTKTIVYCYWFLFYFILWIWQLDSRLLVHFFLTKCVWKIVINISCHKNSWNNIKQTTIIIYILACLRGVCCVSFVPSYLSVIYFPAPTHHSDSKKLSIALNFCIYSFSVQNTL